MTDQNRKRRIDAFDIRRKLNILDKELYDAIEAKAFSLCEKGKIVVNDDPSYRVVCVYGSQPETIVDEALSLAKEVIHTRVKSVQSTSFFNRLTPHEFCVLAYIVDGIEVLGVHDDGVLATIREVDNFESTPFGKYYTYLKDGIKKDISGFLHTYALALDDENRDKFSADIEHLMDSCLVETTLLYLGSRSGIIGCDIKYLEVYAYTLRVLMESLGIFKFVKLLDGDSVLKDIDSLYGGDYYTSMLGAGETVESFQGEKLVYDITQLDDESVEENYRVLRDKNRTTVRLLVCMDEKVTL